MDVIHFVSSSFCNEPSKPLSLSISLFFHFIGIQSDADDCIDAMQCDWLHRHWNFFFHGKTEYKNHYEIDMQMKVKFRNSIVTEPLLEIACQIESDHYAELYFMLVDRLPTNLRRKLMEQDAQQSHHSHKYSCFMLLPTAKPLVIQQQKKKKKKKRP